MTSLLTTLALAGLPALTALTLATMPVAAMAGTPGSLNTAGSVETAETTGTLARTKIVKTTNSLGNEGHTAPNTSNKASTAPAAAPAAGPPSDSPPRASIKTTIGAPPSAFEAASGVSASGHWLFVGSAGFPWSTLRLQLGTHSGFSPLIELQSARLRRWRPAIGFATHWLHRPRLRISGEWLFGWLIQTGDLPRRGPNAELRVRIAAPFRRLAPYLMVGSQSTLLANRTTISRADGAQTSWSFDGEWTGFATLGLVLAIKKRVGLDLGIDMTFYDVPNTQTIPGAHLGLIIGGFRRTRNAQDHRVLGRPAESAIIAQKDATRGKPSP